MGLDVYCECGMHGFTAGSYGGFMEWRKTIAKAVDIELEDMLGFYGTTPWTGDEPFYELLNHSDCDGYIETEECHELVDDFIEYEEEVKKECNIPLNDIEEIANALLNEQEKEWVWEKYQTWREMIEHCSNTGCRIIFA